MLLVSFDGLKEKCPRIAMESCQEIMAEIGNLHAEDLQVDYEIRQGKPERVIAETAGKLGIDLIVICIDGKDNLKVFLSGTITEHVIHHASSPMLVIPFQKNAVPLGLSTGIGLAPDSAMDALQKDPCTVLFTNHNYWSHMIIGYI